MRRIDVEAAYREISTKSASRVEFETAIKWAARAIAGYQIYRETGEVRWLLRAESDRHEAIEHAALVEDDGRTLAGLTEEMEKERVGPG